MMVLFDFPVLPGYPGILILVLHQQPASVRDLSAVRQGVSPVGHTQDLSVGVRRGADVAVATDNLHVGWTAVTTAAGTIQSIHRLLQRHQRSRAAFAVHIQLMILLESPERKIGAVSEVAIIDRYRTLDNASLTASMMPLEVRVAPDTVSTVVL